MLHPPPFPPPILFAGPPPHLALHEEPVRGRSSEEFNCAAVGMGTGDDKLTIEILLQRLRHTGIMPTPVGESSDEDEGDSDESSDDGEVGSLGVLFDGDGNLAISHIQLPSSDEDTGEASSPDRRHQEASTSRPEDASSQHSQSSTADPARKWDSRFSQEDPEFAAAMAAAYEAAVREAESSSSRASPQHLNDDSEDEDRVLRVPMDPGEAPASGNWRGFEVEHVEGSTPSSSPSSKLPSAAGSDAHTDASQAASQQSAADSAASSTVSTEQRQVSHSPWRYALQICTQLIFRSNLPGILMAQNCSPPLHFRPILIHWYCRGFQTCITQTRLVLSHGEVGLPVK